MTKEAGMSKGDAVLKQVVHETEHYTVCVARLPDMYFDTYAIVNKGTGVIEQIHPNLYNARYIAEQFNRWLIQGPSKEEELDIIMQSVLSDPNGRVN